MTEGLAKDLPTRKRGEPKYNNVQATVHGMHGQPVVILLL